MDLFKKGKKGWNEIMYNKVEEMLHAAKSNDLLNSNISKLNEFLGKKEKEEKKNCWLCILSIVGIIAAVTAIVYALYRYFTPDYLDDFEDDFEDEFDDDFLKMKRMKKKL